MGESWKMQQAEDFRAESEALAVILKDLPEADFHRPTLFKNWTIDHILGHLHLFNVAAEASLKGTEAFAKFIDPVVTDMRLGKTILECQFPWLDGLSGRSLFDAWCKGSESCAASFAQADPKERLKWIGPDMSALSSITARQMETWAHGQAVFDFLGLEREEQDRVRNIAHLGNATFGWTFLNRKEEAPKPAPYLELTGPSGVVWHWNDPQKDNVITGQAVEFAQVVTQTRNIADTSLQVTGATACSWMEHAQCFAGPPASPPAEGQRYKVE